MNLDGRTKAAVLVLALGPDAAAEALRCMNAEALRDLARAVTELERTPKPSRRLSIAVAPSAAMKEFPSTR